MAVFREYDDPRMAAVYDALGPGRADTDFYLGLAAELAATSVVDIGCGTGLLACELARRGHVVTGVDPARAMLDIARNRPDGDLVRWIECEAGRLGEAGQAEHVFGDWDRRPAGRGSPEMIFVAATRSA